MAGGVPPQWKYPGVLNGRLIPSNADPQGDDVTDYYAIYDPYDYYSTYLDHVFVLGEDTEPLPDYRVTTNTAPYVEQTNIDVTGINLIRFCWYLKSSVDMPTSRTLVSSGTVIAETTRSLMKPGALLPDDNVPSITVPYTAGNLFTASDRERLITISGMPTADNNGTFRISGIPMSGGLTNPAYEQSDYRIQASPGAGELYEGQMAVIENAAMVSETGSSATITIPGARWVARGYIDGTERVKLVESRLGRAWQRNYMAFHVSQLSGTCTFRFELKLEVS